MKVRVDNYANDYVSLFVRVLDYTSQQAILFKDTIGFLNGIQIIEVLLAPYLDDAYDQIIEEIEKKYQIEEKPMEFYSLEELKKREKQKERVEFAKLMEKFKLLIRIAHKNGLLKERGKDVPVHAEEGILI